MNSDHFARIAQITKKLTNYSDLQVVLQIRMNMDDDLKRAIDTNFNNIWDKFYCR